MYRRLTAHPLVAPLKPNAQRAARTTTPARFLARETARRPAGALYALRDAPDVHVALRHTTPDVDAFDELFVQEIYAEPEPVRAALDALGRPPRVGDLGANIGLFAAWIESTRPGSTLTCVEPDPFNLPILRRAAQANGDRWTIVDAAAAASDGELRFIAGEFAISRAADPGEAGATTVRAVDALALVADVELLKIDIEGGEWALLDDERLDGSATVALALEYHPEQCPEPDARAAAHARLRRGGFTVIDVPTGAPPGYGSLWAYR